MWSVAAIMESSPANNPMKMQPDPIYAVDTSPNADETRESTLPLSVALAFSPIHKRAIGIAIGSAAGLMVAALTLFHVLVPGASESVNLMLLAEYFYGYTVSWSGSLVGFAWAAFVGFVGGWFLAFSRNLILAMMVFVGRTRAELAATRDFLDHI